MDPALVALQQGKVIPWQEVVDPTSYQMYMDLYFNLWILTFRLDITTIRKPMRHNGNDLQKWDLLPWQLVRLFLSIYIIFDIFGGQVGLVVERQARRCPRCTLR